MLHALILARATNHVIGCQGKLPWHLPSELRHFRKTTAGAPVIMGRCTFESIGRCLPGRTNIIVSSQLASASPAGCLVVPTLAAAYAQAAKEGPKQAFVIGGARLYAAALPTADMLYLTEVHAVVEGDTFCPLIDLGEWACQSRCYVAADARNRYAYTLYGYRRRRG